MFFIHTSMFFTTMTYTKSSFQDKKCLLRACTFSDFSPLRPVYSDTTQLNSTSSGVELRRRRYRHFADATQLDVELSCVAINGPLIA